MQPTNEETNQLHNNLLREAAALLLPYLKLSGRQSKASVAPEDVTTLQRACAMLKRVIQMNPANWSAMWFLGKGLYALNQSEQAYDAFAAAYTMEKDNPSVGRELVLACITLGKGTEATRISEELIQRWPSDSGLLANYALALLISNRLAESRAAINRSLQIDPNDLVSRDVLMFVRKVEAGEIPPASSSPPRS